MSLEKRVLELFRQFLGPKAHCYPNYSIDGQKAIQLGYDQCRRVEKAIYDNELLTIRDGKNMKQVLYTAKTHKIQEVWSIVVTDYKYGPIQTDLHHLLQREKDSLYPWSVSADDLEIFLLVMRKHLKGIAPSRFLEFLDYRTGLGLPYEYDLDIKKHYPMPYTQNS